ncbi:MAG TPA: 16S rRNA (adenine(1518)-N(6)/adenine(1519)-N(6))-dimethyltransferase RsmA [Rectinemataceae bacterium]|nr:16S rRNA (adenine(1518)-N(6)/adenine(1519)-N(6))-dimethyltransferase RsmA [Rectinemataceae bacterium]
MPNTEEALAGGPEGRGTLPPDYDAPTSLKSLLEAEGLAMSKRFGQNFLTDRKARTRILEELKAEAGASVWEIGPGIGAMTALALEAGLEVRAFEIDHGFARLLRRCYGERPNFRLIEGDFLRTWRAELEAHGPPDRIFGNLPYSVANAIVCALIEGGLVPPRMVFTMQKEAALRMAAVPGSKDYSAFSVLCTSACKVRLAFDLGAGSFWPAPRVTSSVVSLVPRAKPVAADNRAAFSAFVRAAFSSRRKMLRNNLKANPGVWARKGSTADGAETGTDPIEAALKGLGIRADIRAEALRPEELAAVHEALTRA